MEPLGSLNKGFTVRNTRGLPFDAPYTCTGMQKSVNNPYQAQSRTQPGGGPSWVYSPYLLLKCEASEEENENKAKQAFMHACVCSNQSILPPIIVQSSNQSLYSTFALLHDSSAEKQDKQ